MREEPSLDSRILFRVKKGDLSNVMEEKGEWLRVGLQEGPSGWAHRSLFAEAVQLMKTPSGHAGEISNVFIVGVDTARVREHASTDSRIVHRLKRGEALPSNQTVNDWIQISLPDGKTGWALKDLFVQNQ